MYTGKKIILGSQSPRRLEILRDAGFEVEIVKPKVEEKFPAGLQINKIAEYLSKLKMYDVFSFIGSDNELIICADTMVIFQNKLVGKPKNEETAFRYLKALNGQKHEVVTGVTMRYKGKQLSFTELSTVSFKHLEDDEIKKFIANNEVLDKAGAYNVQEYIGVSKVEGDFYNVMGLPLKQVLHELKQLM
ncbi:MAG TPA: Maf family protein [Chitinophagales bacterium]|nr:Maf family protein [Chitinophagales bacterium]